MKNITFEEIEDVLQTRLPEILRQRCVETNLIYEEISCDERDNYIRDVVNQLTKADISKDTSPAGAHRLMEWELGWKENLEALANGKSLKDLVPMYHGKYTLVHWRQRMIRPVSPFFDYHLFCILIDWAVNKYLSNVDAIFEFGCGPAYNLLRARTFNNKARLIGLDWTTTSQEIIKQICLNGIETRIEGVNFNFFNPDFSLTVPDNSGFITIAALEQTGEDYERFLSFVLEKKPYICVHFEPIDELLDQNHLIDRLSVLYFRKRNYLNGFLTKLRKLQQEGKIEIINEQRTYSGSYFIEGHSLIVWRPL